MYFILVQWGTVSSSYLYLESMGEITLPLDSIKFWLLLETPSGGRIILDRFRRLRDVGLSPFWFCDGVFLQHFFMFDAVYGLYGETFTSMAIFSYRKVSYSRERKWERERI